MYFKYHSARLPPNPIVVCLHGFLQEMHDCLAVPEILHLICEHLQGTPTLMWLACTCRAFKEPALDNLWYHLKNITPLVQCLSPDAWNGRGINRTLRSTGVGFARPLTPSDVATVRKYHHRIQRLTFNSSHVEVAVLQVFSFLFADGFLPNLKHLTWEAEDDDVLPYLPLFLNKKLESVDILVQDPDMTYVSLINGLSIMLSPPAVHRLALRTKNVPEPDYLLPLSSSLGVWSSVRDLSIPGLTVEGLVHIAKMPHLRSLAVGWHIGDIDLGALDHVEAPFPSLVSVSFTAFPKVVNKLLPHFRFTKIEQLTFGYGGNELGDYYTRPHLQQCMATLEDYHYPCSLKKICISYPWVICRLGFTDVISPLLSFRALEQVRVVLENTLEVSVENAAKMAEAWPNITVLHIASNGHGTPLTKLSSLVLLAQRCSGLRRLALKFDATDADTRTTLLEAMNNSDLGPPNPNLKYLEVGESLISHKEFVAMLLWELFPNLERIRSRASINQDGLLYHSRWKRVGQVLLPLLRMAKRRGEQGMGVGWSGVSTQFEDRRLKSWWSEDDSGRRSDGDRTDEYEESDDD
ncbi:hypothetical protein P691DRAFT_774662 [Macrolepiota fuliginosa MF-IS2]|uniref:F-box domain-containing protein n=1 Tax=Macrolepiota fuliginosa MF-IS2 TaxID=1400762 RepID=A0A9P5XEE3_9AGAR|nr:hypothetical protein P691DRAFT_774662 [Macrolepiota fuliginosa MF-IS2]